MTCAGEVELFACLGDRLVHKSLDGRPLFPQTEPTFVTRITKIGPLERFRRVYECSAQICSWESSAYLG